MTLFTSKYLFFVLFSKKWTKNVRVVCIYKIDKEEQVAFKATSEINCARYYGDLNWNSSRERLR